MTTLGACHLRPIEGKDLERIRAWRNSKRIRSVMFSEGIISAEDQKEWFARIKKDNRVRYYTFEIKGRPWGIVNFVDIDRRKFSSSWGFYIGTSSAPRKSGKAMGYLGLQQAFERLKLKKINGETFIFNHRGLNYHRYFGFKEEGRLNRYAVKNKRKFKVIGFSLSRETWLRRKESLKKEIFTSI